MSVDVSHTIAGNGKGTPIIFVHGVGETSSMWEPIIRGLPNRRPHIRYDLRGHGLSPAPEGPYTIDDFVSDHKRLLSHLNFPYSDIIGFSLGGLVAQAVAIRHPELVRRLIVIGSVAGRTEDEKKRVAERLRMLEEKGPVEVARVSVDRWFTPEYLASNPDVYEATLSRMKGLNTAAYLAAYRVLATTDFINELSSIRAPTLAINGEGDIGSPPRMSKTIARLVQYGSARTIPSAKHAVIKEQPKRITKEVHDFVY